MKALLITILAGFICAFSTTLSAQHSSKNTGSWNNNNTWVNVAPPYSLGNNSTVKINCDNTVYANQSISFSNSGILDVCGELNVEGNIGGKNNLQITVASGGKLIVNGDVDLMNNTTLIVNGDMQVNNLTGFNQNTNFLLGNGNLYVLGEIEGFNTSLFGGSIIFDPLPVELISFDVYQYNNSVIIDWTTASETNNDYFTLEKSKDLFHWDIIGNINGAGNSNELKYYSFCDVNISEGIWYYRLKQTDYDGKYEYFSPVSVNVTLNNNLKIIKASNSHHTLEIHLKTSTENANLTIYDISGRIIETTKVNPSNTSQLIRISALNYKSGIILILNLQDSKEFTTLKYQVK
ncbi:MAG: hypothetical protein KGZ97_11255 [Bacteroidetes bacterium]|nr:hypothetical protein [Bacteroidota bacterium]